MPINDVYEAQIIQDLNGEEAVNTFHFQQLETSGSAADLAVRIINQWIAANWETLVSLGLSFVEIAIRNLFDPDERAVTPVGIAGDGIGEGLPPHDAIRLTFSTALASIRKGRKAIAGLLESGQSDGTLNAGGVTAWQAMIDDTFTQPLVNPSLAPRYQYVIVKRIKYTTPGGTTAYRLPANLGETVLADASSGVVSAFIRTQRSRDFAE